MILSIVEIVIERNVAAACSSVSSSTSLRARPAALFGCCSPLAERSLPSGSKSLITSRRVKRLAFPAKRYPPPTPARRVDDAGAPEDAQHLGEMMRGDAVFLRDLHGRKLARRIGGELQDGIEGKVGGFLQFHVILR